MAERDVLEDTTLLQRVVLLGVLSLRENGDTPTSSDEIRRVCNECENRANEESVGSLSESDVIRTMNRLVDSRVIEERPATQTSPVGKGRPTYALAVDPDSVHGVLTTDDRLEDLLDAADVSR